MMRAAPPTMATASQNPILLAVGEVSEAYVLARFTAAPSTIPPPMKLRMRRLKPGHRRSFGFNVRRAPSLWSLLLRVLGGGKRPGDGGPGGKQRDTSARIASDEESDPVPENSTLRCSPHSDEANFHRLDAQLDDLRRSRATIPRS